MTKKINYWKNVKKLREERWFSQQQLSDMLWLSRASIAHIETWIRDIKPHELSELSKIFDIPEDIITSWDNLETIEVQKDEKERFSELIIYILEICWAKANLWKTVLYKLLYFAEFDYFELTWKNLSWYPFYRLPMWPAPYNFDSLVEELEQDKKIVKIIAPYWNYYQERFIPTIESKKDCFTVEQKNIINDVIDRYSDFTAKEISDLSHEDMPWKLSWDLEHIDYDLVTRRDYPFSPKKREQYKNQAFSEIKASWMFEDLISEPDLYEEYR